MATYTTTVEKFEELTKKVNKIFKKIDKFNPNVVHEFKELRRYVKEVPMYNIVDNVRMNFIRNVLVEVVDFDLCIEERVTADDGSRVVAILEAVENGKNLVHVVNRDEETDRYNHYATANLRCDHCRTKHFRKKVAVVSKSNGEEIMVGCSCLKDYFGYAEDQAVFGYEQIDSIINDLSETYIDFDAFQRCTKYVETAEYLAKCVAEIRENGYKNGYDEKPTKYAAMKRTSVTDEDEKIARDIINLFKEYNAEISFDQNVKTAVTAEYCKAADGFVAYAYLAYMKVLEKESFKRQKEAEKEVSNFVGKVGDKITITAKAIYAGGYSTDFGYTNIWKFTDKDGNVFIWKTQNDLEGMWDYTNEKYRVGKEYKVTGKVKEHSEYNGTKQTVLTRCKACAV